MWRHYAVRIRFMSPTRICYRLLCTFFNLYIFMFNTGQWALCPLPFSVQPLLCFLLTALAEQPTAEAACFFVKQRDSSPLCLCLLMCCPLYFIWTGSWNFFSTPSLQLDLLIKGLRKNTRTFTWLIRLRWSTFLRKLWSPWNLHMVTTRRFHRGHQKVCQVRVDWAPQRVQIVWETLVTVSRNATKKESNWK